MYVYLCYPGNRYLFVYFTTACCCPTFARLNSGVVFYAHAVIVSFLNQCFIPCVLKWLFDLVNVRSLCKVYLLRCYLFFLVLIYCVVRLLLDNMIRCEQRFGNEFSVLTRG